MSTTLIRASPPVYANGPHRVVWPASPATGDPATAKGCPFTAKTPPLPLPCSVAFFPLNENTPGIYLAGQDFVAKIGFSAGSRSDLGGGLAGTRDRALDLALAQPPLVCPLAPTGGDALSLDIVSHKKI